MLRKTGRLLRTLSHLRPSQLLGQVYYRLYKPKPDWQVKLQRRPVVNPFVTGVSKLGQLDGPAEFRCLNTCYQFSTASEWDNPQHLFLWRYNLHYFDYLNHRGCENNDRWSRDLITRWINEHKTGIGWEPYPTSLRIVNWIRCCLEKGALSNEAVDSIAVQADHLSRQREFHIGANHLFTNGKTLLFAGCFFKGARANAWLTQGLEILLKEVREQFLNDGGHYERSPMYHIILLEDLLDLLNIIRVYELNDTSELRSMLSSAVVRALDWVKKMTLPNQRFPLFGDSVQGIGPLRIDIEEYAQRLGVAIPGPFEGSSYLAESGFARIEQSPGVVIFATLEGPRPTFQPGHSHADSLSFELYMDGEPILVDAGVPTYEATIERVESRGTAAHNTLQIDHANSSEVWSSFRVGRRARVKHSPFEVQNEQLTLTASHDGFRNLRGKPIHIRTWRASETQFVIEDRLESDFNQEVRLRFRAAPNLSWVQVEPSVWYLKRGSNSILRLSSDPKMEYRIESGSYHPEFLKSMPIEVLTGKCLINSPVVFQHKLKCIST